MKVIDFLCKPGVHEPCAQEQDLSCTGPVQWLSVRGEAVHSSLHGFQKKALLRHLSTNLALARMLAQARFRPRFEGAEPLLADRVSLRYFYRYH